ncbi:hypothetical protein MTP99_012291 [Tenebrio molitor]|nr:hypothetical protein MTP99_012291 [Tenebrio molitor]
MQLRRPESTQSDLQKDTILGFLSYVTRQLLIYGMIKKDCLKAKVNKKQVQCKNLHRDEKCLSIFQSVSTVFPKSTVQIQIHYCSCKESQEQYLSYTL